jgi:hypothetical protein
MVSAGEMRNGDGDQGHARMVAGRSPKTPCAGGEAETAAAGITGRWKLTHRQDVLAAPAGL